MKGSQLNRRQQRTRSSSGRSGGLGGGRSEVFGFGGGGGSSEGLGGGGSLLRAHVLAGAVALLAILGLLMTGHASAALPPSFGTGGTGAGGISVEALGIAVDQGSGDVYVADRENNRVEKFGPEGEFLLAFGWGVADGTTEALQTCTTTCFSGIRGGGAGQFGEAEGIAVDNSAGPSGGDVYVLDRSNSRIEKFGPQGEFLLAFGEAGPGPGQFEGLTSHALAVGSSGIVYVGDFGRVQRFTEVGAVLGEIPLAGVERIENMTVDSAGDLYVQTNSLPGVHKYDAAGTELGTARDEPGNGESLAISVGPADELFVNDFQPPTSHVITFDPVGKQIASFDRGTQAETGYRGIGYSEFTGAIYVLNAGSVRIVPVPPPGPYVLPGSESATGVGTTSATLGATLNPEGPEATTYFFEYGTEAGVYGQTSPIPPAALTGGEFEDQPVSSALTGLQTRTTYHYRVVAENAAAEVTRGPDQTFTTLPPVSIDSTSSSGVSATAATLETELNPHGLPTTYRFQYGTTAGYGSSTPTASAASGEADVLRTAQVQGLEPLTTYHYRVIATNSLGTSEGPDRTFTTQGLSVAGLLPDGRAWEMVTPPNKHGAPLRPISENGALIQAAADGSAFASVALGALGPESQGNRSLQDSQFLSTRGPAGWSTTDISTPHEEITEVHVGFPSEYRFFAEDFSSAVVQPEGSTPLSPQTTERTPYLREADGAFAPLVTATNVPPGTEFGGEESTGHQGERGVEFITASPDARHVVLTSPQLLTEEFAPSFVANGESNLYVQSGGTLTLASILPNHESTSEAGLSVGVGNDNHNVRGAISADGNRVIFETTGVGRNLYLRDVAADETVQLDAVQSGSGGPEVSEFDAASADDSRVFFTDTARLTEDSTAEPAEPDLYMCEVEAIAGHLSCVLTDLSANHLHPGEPAAVFGGGSGAVSIDATGTHVYFTADGVLTETPDAHGEVARPADCRSEGEGTCNLYVADTETGKVSLVAVLSSHDDPDWMGRTQLHILANLTARSSPDGRWFTFMSTRPLTGYDNRDAKSGRRDAEVFLFDAVAQTLSCVSCNPTGARPVGVLDPPVEVIPHLLVDGPGTWGGRSLAASIPGWTNMSIEEARHQSRYLSNSGRLFFNSSDALVPSDTNGVMDVYEFEPPGVGSCTTTSSTFSPTSGGCVSQISSGTSAEESAFLDASESGDDVFFLTQSRLTSKDVDSAYDVYDASVGGGEPTVVNPPACEGDACQQPAVPPNDATPGSLTFNGAGNVKECPKGKKLQKGRCVKKQQKKAKKHKHHEKSKQGKKRKSAGMKQKKSKRADGKSQGGNE
jgi:NHL repeat/WD40-like Beta Propeller Repeat